MANLDLTRILNLCRLGRDGLIAYNPSLKKYILEEPRNSRRLSSDLASKIRSRGKEVKDLYESLSNSTGALVEIYEFSEVLQEKYALRLEQARKVKDLAEQNEKLAGIFGEIKADILRALGLVDIKDKREILPDERLKLALQFGRRYFGI